MKKVEVAEYENRVVAFIDILGFSSIIKATEKKVRGIDNSLLIKKIATSINIIEKRFLYQNSILDKTVTQFSDSIYISFPEKEEGAVIEMLQDIQRSVVSLIKNGFVVRGAITLGKAIHNEKMLFGPAIVAAYELEKTSFYPRIIVDRKVLNLGIKKYSPMNDWKREVELIFNTVARDHDGQWFIDYFDVSIPPVFFKSVDYCQYLFELKKIILKGLKNKDNNIRLKYGWMKEKFNNSIVSYLREEFYFEIKESGNTNFYKFCKKYLQPIP